MEDKTPNLSESLTVKRYARLLRRITLTWPAKRDSTLFSYVLKEVSLVVCAMRVLTSLADLTEAVGVGSVSSLKVTVECSDFRD